MTETSFCVLHRKKCITAREMFCCYYIFLEDSYKCEEHTGLSWAAHMYRYEFQALHATHAMSEHMGNLTRSKICSVTGCLQVLSII